MGGRTPTSRHRPSSPELEILSLWLYLLWRYSPEMALEMEPIVMSVVDPGLAAAPSMAATPSIAAATPSMAATPPGPMAPPWAARAGVSGPWK